MNFPILFEEKKHRKGYVAPGKANFTSGGIYINKDFTKNLRKMWKKYGYITNIKERIECELELTKEEYLFITFLVTEKVKNLDGEMLANDLISVKNSRIKRRLGHFRMERDFIVMDPDPEHFVIRIDLRISRG